MSCPRPPGGVLRVGPSGPDGIRIGLAVRFGRVVGVVVALAFFASCAPLPPPGSPQPPPGAPGAPPVPRGPYRLDREPSMDVGIGLDLDSLTLIPPAGTRVASFSGAGETAIGETGEPLQGQTTNGGWQISWQGERGSRTVTPLSAADTVWLGDADDARRAAPTGIRWQGKTWRGRLKLFRNPRGKLTLASRVPLETYLLGVVPGEIGALANDLLEAGRAQAIAARSYTLFYRGRRGSEGFDLFGTVEDQVYGPIESERSLATRCVESTRGDLALSTDGPIRANYCSTCGGILAEVWEAWPAPPLPYLVSHRDAGGTRDYCAESPHYRWREEWTAQEFLGNLGTFGPREGVPLPPDGVGEIRDVRIERRSRSGRAWLLVTETTTGRIEVPAYALRRVLRRGGNSERILRSNLIKVDVRRDPRTRRALSVVATGAGSGHGVGLCQTGAIGMAKAGLKADRILLHYYPGIELKRFYAR